MTATTMPPATVSAPAKRERRKYAAPVFHKTCPECGTKFDTSHGGKEFCSTPHREAFMNRCAARGKTLLPRALAWRMTRGKKGVGSDCMADMVRLLDSYAAEDRAAGRPPMTNYMEALYSGPTLKWNDR